MARILEKAERAVGRLLGGSVSPNHRQAIWRPSFQLADRLALSDEFAGDPTASRFNRRLWGQVGVVAVETAAMTELLRDNPESEEAVAFTVKGYVCVGTFERPEEAIGYVGATLNEQRRGHALRLGRGAVQFGIGVRTPDGIFIPPPQDAIVTMGPMPVTEIGRPGSGFAQTHFS